MKLHEQLQQISQRLRLPDNAARQIVCLALRQPRDETLLRPHEELALALASWLHNIAGILPVDATLLLREMSPLLQSLAPGLRQSWQDKKTNAAVPPQGLHICDNRYANWDGHDYWDVKLSGYIRQLPSPAIWRTSVHFAGLYFAYLHKEETANEHKPSSNTQPAG